MNPASVTGAREEASTVPAPVVRRGAARPAPERNPELAHLSLEALRDYRRALSDEENRVSYWRRVLQARLDVVRAVGSGPAAVDNLREVLSGVVPRSNRTALIEVVAAGDMPPLPDLAPLWQREPVADDEPGNAELALGLEEAERRLSEYRGALIQRLEASTADLIARYREEPGACLVALPLQRRGGTARPA
ncbi:MAG: hypothetical protein ACJ74O_08015 [Frankiaceae bacterium]